MFSLDYFFYGNCFMNNASKARADKLMPEKEVFKVDLLLGSMTIFMYMPKMRCRLPRKTAAESPFGASARCHGKLESIYVGRRVCTERVLLAETRHRNRATSTISVKFLTFTIAVQILSFVMLC